MRGKNSKDETIGIFLIGKDEVGKNFFAGEFDVGVEDLKDAKGLEKLKITPEKINYFTLFHELAHATDKRLLFSTGGPQQDADVQMIEGHLTEVRGDIFACLFSIKETGNKDYAEYILKRRLVSHIGAMGRYAYREHDKLYMGALDYMNARALTYIIQNVSPKLLASKSLKEISEIADDIREHCAMSKEELQAVARDLSGAMKK